MKLQTILITLALSLVIPTTVSADILLDQTPSGYMPAIELVESDIDLHIVSPPSDNGDIELHANIDVAKQYAEQMGYVQTSPLTDAQQTWCFNFFYAGKRPDDYRKGYRFLLNCGSGFVYATEGGNNAH